MITGSTALFAILGDPVAQSLSPVLHNHWIAAAGLDAVYAALRIPEAQADAAFRALDGFGFAGANVTTPHKERAAATARRSSPAVRALGAANTLKALPEGGFEAHNTDAPGFVAALTAAHPTWRTQARSVLVLGAGGAARAVGYGLAAAGAPAVAFCNRTYARAEEAAAALSGLPVAAAAYPWDELAPACAAADIIVNATTLGFKGAPSIDWPLDACKPNAIVAETIYRPLETPLLAGARARGLAVMDGLDMLIHQAALAFEIWFGQAPKIEGARSLALSAP